jgi:hypothetical protein
VAEVAGKPPAAGGSLVGGDRLAAAAAAAVVVMDLLLALDEQLAQRRHQHHPPRGGAVESGHQWGQGAPCWHCGQGRVALSAVAVAVLLPVASCQQQIFADNTSFIFVLRKSKLIN